jgi:hypothetical protein
VGVRGSGVKLLIVATRSPTSATVWLTTGRSPLIAANKLPTSGSGASTNAKRV